MRDETLTPAARSALFAQAPNIPESENAYFFLLGMDAPAGSDPFVVGKARLEGFRTRLAAPRNVRLAQPEKKAAFSLPKQFSRDFCDSATSNCLQIYQQAEGEILKIVSDSPFFVQRCERVYGYADFADVSVPDIGPFWPAYNVALSCTRFRHALAAIDIRHGKTPQALASLARDNAFWRMIIEKANNLLPKMVATAALRIQSQFLSNVLSADTALAANDFVLVTELTRPLSAAEQDLTASWLWEARGATQFLFGLEASLRAGEQRNPARSTIYALRLFFGYRRNATINMTAHRFNRITAFYRSKPSFVVQHQTAFAAEVSNLGMGFPLYNRAGKMIVNQGAPEFWDFPLRLYDLDALIRLVRLKQRILAQGLGDANVQAFLDQSGPALHDPYTERPMNWDAKRRVLWSSAHSKKEAPSQRIEVAL